MCWVRSSVVCFVLYCFWFVCTLYRTSDLLMIRVANTLHGLTFCLWTLSIEILFVCLSHKNFHFYSQIYHNFILWFLVSFTDFKKILMFSLSSFIVSFLHFSFWSTCNLFHFKVWDMKRTWLFLPERPSVCPGIPGHLLRRLSFITGWNATFTMLYIPEFLPIPALPLVPPWPAYSCTSASLSLFL